MITALRGGSGKTILSLGLASAFKEHGKSVSPFKKGPDFIDPSWLSLAAGRPCHNLDPFMMNQDQLLESFFLYSRDSDIAVIEGNRGLFDGLEMDGCCSSAELGRTLRSPVLLIVDVTMTTRTIAALVLGCQTFDPELDLRGVLLNRVGGERQESLVRRSIEHYCGIPVVGSVRKLRKNLFPERHMGLIPHQETERAMEAVDWARGIAEDSLDLDAILDIARGAGPLEWTPPRKGETPATGVGPESPKPRIGYIEDSAFWFYYPENLDALRDLGAEVFPVSAMKQDAPGDLDALYIGGGFPETQAERLADNKSFRRDLKEKIENGLPVYAECGGLMYLGENLLVGENRYPMTGILPVDFILEKKPQGHGYTILEVTGDNPFFDAGTVLRGHEFHYSRPVVLDKEGVRTVFKVNRGHGFDGLSDGLVKRNLLATYTHIHASGTPVWAERMVSKAVEHRERQRGKNLSQFKKRD